jgi:hypothetical protein
MSVSFPGAEAVYLGDIKVWPSEGGGGSAPVFNEATGGTVTEYEGTGLNTGKTFRVHTFTAGGDFVVTRGGQPFRVLLVGGGSAGEKGYIQNRGGAGGAGGKVLDTVATLAAGTVPVVVGAAGAASTLGDLTSATGVDGGAGGGPQAAGSPGPSSDITGTGTNYGGGGGGGARSGSPNSDQYAAGGTGGAGGGGDGGGAQATYIPSCWPGNPGVANTGGGGGGGATIDNASGGPAEERAGGDGGTGVVIVSYVIADVNAPSGGGSAPAMGGAVASGGTETEFTSKHQPYKAHEFTANGTLVVTQRGMATIAVAAGGGGGGGFSGGNSGGCGGAGGLIIADVVLEVGEYEVNIGGGGSPGPFSTGRDNDTATNGGDSWLGPWRAQGGGAGGAGDWADAYPINHAGRAGGSGGSGGSYWGPAGAGRTSSVFGTYYGAQGHDGRVNTGVGGGAGSSGDDGGAGVEVNLTGTTITLCRGGGAQGHGAANSGDGGASGNPASAGSAGRVIVRTMVGAAVPTPTYNDATGGTIVDVPDYNGTGQTWRIHTFMASSDLVVTRAVRPFRVLACGGGSNGGGGGPYCAEGGRGAWGGTTDTTTTLVPGPNPIVVGGPGGGTSSLGSIVGVGASNGARLVSDITGTPTTYAGPGGGQGSCGSPGSPGGGGTFPGGEGGGGGGIGNSPPYDAGPGGGGAQGVVIVAYQIG